MTYTGNIPAINMPLVAQRIGISPIRTVCECAVGPIQESIAPAFKGKCFKLLLIEPHKYFADEAERQLETKVHRVAIGPTSGRATMIENWSSTFLKGTWAPTPTKNTNEFEVDIVTFDTLDDGQIDIFNLDCEGQEWAVISNMRSRPKLFTIEIMDSNPYANNINEWLKENNYIMDSYTGPWSETKTYIRHEAR